MVRGLLREHSGDSEDSEDSDDDDDRNGIASRASFVFKSSNFGLNWTWTQLPDALRISTFATDPTNNSTLYGIAANCIARSYDRGDTWGSCWKAANLSGSFTNMAIKDSKTMVILRNGDVPLRTKDGGASWHPLTSAGSVHLQSAEYSWSGKTLVYHGAGGVQSSAHPHAGYVWSSTDDGDTWVDETADLVTMAVGAGQFFGGTFYLNTAGQGILSKVLET